MVLTIVYFHRWDKKVWDAAQEAQKEENERFGPQAGTLPKGDQKSMAEQAKAILEGKMKWRPSWIDYGRAREVETNININDGGRSSRQNEELGGSAEAT